MKLITEYENVTQVLFGKAVFAALMCGRKYAMKSARVEVVWIMQY
jgi:hypothetical protein